MIHTLTITKSDEYADPGASFSTYCWQRSTIEKDQETLDIAIYWTDRELEAHDPLCDGVSARDPLLEGLEHWGEGLQIQLPDLEELGFEWAQIEGEGDFVGQCCEIWWRITLEGQGTNLTEKWELCAAGKQPFDEYGEEIEVETVFVVGAEQMVQLSHATHSPFVRTEV